MVGLSASDQNGSAVDSPRNQTQSTPANRFGIGYSFRRGIGCGFDRGITNLGNETVPQ